MPLFDIDSKISTKISSKLVKDLWSLRMFDLPTNSATMLRDWSFSCSWMNGCCRSDLYFGRFVSSLIKLEKPTEWCVNTWWKALIDNWLTKYLQNYKNPPKTPCRCNFGSSEARRLAPPGTTAQTRKPTCFGKETFR